MNRTGGNKWIYTFQNAREPWFRLWNGPGYGISRGPGHDERWMSHGYDGRRVGPMAMLDLNGKEGYGRNYSPDGPAVEQSIGEVKR